MPGTLAPLHERLAAAVRLRLAIARAACDGDSGEWFAGDKWNVYRAEDEAAHDLDYRGEENRLVVYGNVKDQSSHIALNDPAWVIRECDRDLRVLERHVDTAVGSRFPDQEGGYCQGCNANFREEYAEEWPCPEIRDLAAVYEPGWEKR